MSRVPRAMLVLCLAVAAAASAQETRLGSDFRREGEAIRTSCSSFNFKSFASCAYTLFTDHPMHVAAGSLAPQNGFAFGPAFVYHWTPNESWRLSWDLDAVAATSGSWRAGGYMTAVWNRRRGIVVRPGGSGAAPSDLAVHEYPVFHLLAQSISLNKLSYFGEGPNTSDTARSFFGMRQTIAGANALWPLFEKWNISLFGEANGRFVEIRPSDGPLAPAPGVSRQPAFAQFGEGVRIRPEFAGGFIRLNYLVTLQQYVAPGDSTFTFQRFTTDLAHQFPLYRSTRSPAPKDFNGPDDCSASPGAQPCPAVSRNLEGAIGLRFLMNQSIVPAGHVVPFYFQPTLGGSDINGQPALASYQDYRFRAPNSILLRASFEHSVYGPLGFTAMLDAGKVALNRGDLDFSHLRHSYSAGLTLRAGGFPMVVLLFSWGGSEGTHTTALMNTALLGGSSRPSLY